MKKLLLVFLLLSFLAGCTATHMVESNKKPDFNPGNDSTLVIIRDQFLGNAIVVWNYVDGKLVGETKGYTYFTAKVKPGMHYVIAESENSTCVQINFKPGKIYFLHQDIWPGLWRARSGLSVLNKSDALKAISSCKYWEYDKKNPGEDMEKSKYEQAVKDYHVDVKKKPADYNPFLEYGGYTI